PSTARAGARGTGRSRGAQAEKGPSRSGRARTTGTACASEHPAGGSGLSGRLAPPRRPVFPCRRGRDTIPPLLALPSTLAPGGTMLPPRRLLLPLLSLSALAAGSRADDYPQWRGPNRDGVSKETGLLKQWPKGGPKLLWKVTNLGKGYSTPSVAKGRIYVLSNREDEEFALALDAGDTGKL